MVVTSEIKKGLDLVLLAEAYAKSGAVRSADKSNPTISIQSFLENVKNIDEFVKRIPVEKILELNDKSKKSKDDTIADDREYMAAVESGDTETAQRMVDEAAERAFADSKVRDEDGKPLGYIIGAAAMITFL